MQPHKRNDDGLMHALCVLDCSPHHQSNAGKVQIADGKDGGAAAGGYKR